MSDVKNLFKKNSILFESYFGNLLFLKTEDIKFLHAVCGFYFDPQISSNAQELNNCLLNSSLFEMLHKESLSKLKSHPRVYWEEEKYNPNDKSIGLMVASTNGYLFENSDKYVLTKMLRPERVVLYLPLLLDWAEYYLPKSVNESLYARQVLYSLTQFLKNQPNRRELILVNTPNEISAIVKEPNVKQK